MAEFNDPIELLKCAYNGYKRDRRLSLLSMSYFIAMWLCVLESIYVGNLCIGSEVGNEDVLFYLWSFGVYTGLFMFAFMYSLDRAARDGKRILRGESSEG